MKIFFVGSWNAQTARTNASELEGRGKKESLYRPEIGSEIDLVASKYDLAIWLGNGMFWNALVPAAGATSDGAYSVRTLML